MRYKVKLTRPAESDVLSSYEHILELTSSRVADKWLVGLFQSIYSLEEMPARCRLIAEADEIGKPLRQHLYGKRSGVYRIIFDIEEQSDDGPRVRVFRIWHGARDEITAADVNSEE